MGEPARGYSWPPFEEGHTLSMRHGANSERMKAPLVDELLEGLDEHAPWNTMPAFAPMRLLWADAGAEYLLRVSRFWATVGEHGGLVDRKGDGYDRLERIRARFERLSDQLGLGASGLAKLMRTIGSIDAPAASEGLEALKATGAQLREAAERRSPSPGVPNADRPDQEHEQLDEQGGDGDDEGGDRDGA